MLNTRHHSKNPLKQALSCKKLHLNFFRNQLNNIKFNHQPCTLRQFSTISNLNSRVPYFPYGEADFPSIRRSKQFYIDKTHLIPLLESSGKQLFFVRPPRWGKSLLLSMLTAYYDIDQKDQFDEVFNGLWIGKPENHTPLKNEFHVLHFDFSIDVIGSPEDIKKALFKKINTEIKRFLIVHNMEDIIPEIISTDALESFDNFVTEMLKGKSKLMVLVDEYDRFANKLMFENPEMYKLIVEGKRGDATSSPIRSFFERLKQASACGLAEFRSLIVGITPIALADASGYNVAKNISQYEMFGDLVGFNESNLRLGLSNIGILDDQQNNAISTMKKFYNGYHFPGSSQPLFNTTLSMYFMDKLLTHKQFRLDVLEGKDIPLTDMIDSNTKISENVFATLASTQVSTPIIQQLLATNFVKVNTSIVSSFKLREIIEPPTTELSVKQVWDNTLSLMYYHGMLTFSKDNSSCKTLLIPNEIAQKQYFYELEKIVSLTQNDMMLLYKHPSVETVKKILENIIGERYIHYDNYFSEGALQHAIYCVLQAYYKQGNSYFQVKTETGINEQKEDNDFDKRTDIILESDKDVIIFELKRIRPNGLTWHDKQLKYILKQRTKSKSKILIEQYRRTMFDILSGKWKHPKTIERINEGLSELFENELLNLPLNETYLFGTDKEEMKIVGHVVEKAKTQLSDYVKLLKENKKFSKPIHAFVVVQVGASIIVQKTDK